jgi:uncharacterized protein YkwD
VQPGDDIWLIAVAHGLNMEQLAATNGLTDPYWIHPGDKLWVPAKPAVVKQPPAPKKTPVAAPAPPPAAAIPPATPPITNAVAAPAVDTPGVTATDVVTTTIENPPAPAPETAPSAEVAAVQPQPTPAIDNAAALIFDRMNEQRAAYGLPALIWSAELAQAAQAHAADCANRGWGSHVGSDGARLRTRYARVGYGASWASENWANARNPQQAFDMWWYEPPGADPHRQNILGAYYTEIGIGVAQGGWGYYFVADFGSR